MCIPNVRYHMTSVEYGQVLSVNTQKGELKTQITPVLPSHFSWCHPQKYGTFNPEKQKKSSRPNGRVVRTVI